MRAVMINTMAVLRAIDFPELSLFSQIMLVGSFAGYISKAVDFPIVHSPFDLIPLW